MSILSAFNTQLIQFFDELCNTFPEDKDIKMATEAIKGAKKINPRLILDLFVEHVYKECASAIYDRNIHQFRQVAQRKINTQFNEMTSALAVFDRHWDTMGDKNHEVIWQYMKVLCILSEKAIKAG
jgi:flagellin-specific chaperone FliS